MTSFIFNVGVCFTAAIVLLIYWRNRRYLRQSKARMHSYESQLAELRDTEVILRQDIVSLQNKLRHAVEDPITGLLGWQLFEDRLNQSLRESARYQLTMGILFVDVDDFKVINNALGYETADLLLAAIAERLQACIRGVDSVSRFTKDTFVILLTQLGKPETAAVVAQRILQTLAEPFQVKEHELYITSCIGIAIYPTDGQDAVGLLRGADHALRIAKEKGSQVYQFYQEKTHINSQRELALYNNLKREAVYQEFKLYYQPVVNVLNEAIFCMDALLYWQHSELGLIGSQEVFNHAEKQRKLNPISEWMLQNACRQFLQWRSLGFNPQYLSVSISLKQLDSSHFIYSISQILQDVGFPPEHLLLIIKDSQAIVPMDVLEKAFNMLKYIGIKLVIDNFGAGVFSLCHLKKFTVNYLRLDPALVDDIEVDEHTVTLVKSIMSLAKALSIELIIQGVESEQQMTTLKGLGCVLMQGVLLGLPLPEHEVTSKMVAV